MTRFCVALAVLVVCACAASASPGAADANRACDVDTHRKLECDHLYPQLADKVRDVCVRSWSCASRFLRPESVARMVDCEAHSPCSVDCSNADDGLAPLAEEIAFTSACEEHAASCRLDCKELARGHRGNVAQFWSDMSACFAQPECGEPARCLASASRRPLQAIGCML
jgi:hypothetical protein